MAERPILFSAPMVRALLSGEKTQTRRIIKPQPIDIELFRILGPDGKVHYSRPEGHADIEVARNTHGYTVLSGLDWLIGSSCPYGEPGDRLWVRETWQALSFGDYLPTRDRPPVDLRYFASDPCADLDAGVRGYPWRPSIHMPRWACRIELEITAIRAERLNSCSEKDAIAEGSREPSLVPIIGAGWSERDVYARLWEHINGKGAWAINPWVWVVEFKRVQA